MGSDFQRLMDGGRHAYELAAGLCSLHGVLIFANQSTVPTPSENGWQAGR